jgi:hypothetical protein
LTDSIWLLIISWKLAMALFSWGLVHWPSIGKEASGGSIVVRKVVTSWMVMSCSV